MKSELREYLRKLGRKGGQTTLRRYGKKQMREWGRLGGRPKRGKRHAD